MKDIFKGFKNFILRGNVIELAVGVIIGASFNGVVSGLVKGILTPLIGVIAKVPNLSGLTFTVNGSVFMYGDLLNSLISFFLVAFTIYFGVVLPMNALHNKKPVPPTSKKCPECRTEIPVDARRCAHCTQVIL